MSISKVKSLESPGYIYDCSKHKIIHTCEWTLSCTHIRARMHQIIELQHMHNQQRMKYKLLSVYSPFRKLHLYGIKCTRTK